jgi:glycosyltransferase involved in cell wall biosynthesis
LVSVIISCYNSGKYLSNAIQSVLDQDYKNVELIFVNDGSTDLSLSIAESFAAKDARIKVFSKPNGGLNSARNFGAKYISPKSEALIFFDADDVMESTLIGSLFCELKRDESVGAAYCDFKYIDQNGNHVEKFLRNKRLIPAKKWFTELSEVERFTPFFSIYSGTIMAEAFTMMKKELFFKYGGWDEINFPKGDTYGESIPLFSAIALNHKIVYVNEQLYLYRRHNSQITSANFDKDYIQKKIDRIMVNKTYPEKAIKYQVQKTIRLVKYRLPLYNYFKGSLKHELRYRPLSAFKNLISKSLLYIYSLRF